MAVIRLYRRFYRINSRKSGDLYSLIDPVSISANVYEKDTPNLIEANPPITRESEGIYYVDLNPILYSYDKTYDLKWTAQYINIAPLKNLVTSFKLNPTNFGTGGEIYTEVENQIIEVIIL